MEYQSLRILIVDDEVNIRKTLSLCCETQGHRCTCASTALDAIKAANELIFDMAFVDLRLGTDNGLECIPNLLSANPWLKIVVVTAYATIDSAVKAIQMGAVDYLPKPFVPEQLSAILLRIQAMRRMESRIQTLQDDLGRLQPLLN